MKKISTYNDSITVDGYGGKAFWMNWMNRNGIQVPKSIFVPALNRDEIIYLQESGRFQEELQRSISEIFHEDKALAIRSSELSEDSERESKAGYFRTFLNVDNDVESVFSCILQMASDLSENDSLGIIIQEMISPSFSGVAFSSNPWNGKKSEVYISVISGLGDKLVSGMDTGEDIKLTVQDGIFHVQKYKTALEEEKILQIAKVTKFIEKSLNMPVDIEWCIEKESKKLVVLQCRPITGIFLNSSEIIPLSSLPLDLPQYLVNSKKINLRFIAEKNKIMISKAYLAVYNCIQEDAPEIQTSIDKSKFYKGFSVVLLSPSNINGKVQRYFVGNSTQVYSSTKCHRFGVRAVADYCDIKNCIADLYHIAKEEQWTCSIIIQEILDAKYTGIIKQNKDGYVVEIAKGHFLSKGLFPMSIYVTDFEGSLIYKQEVMQSRYIDIVEGCKLDYYDQEEDYIAFSEEFIKKIAIHFSDIVSRDHMVVEFGILNDENLTPYLIDCVEETASLEISCQAIEKGILSEGRIKGKLVKVDLNDSEEILNMHYYDISEENESSEEYIIFYAHSPSIHLLKLLKQYEPSHIGFVFQTGSLLCHMSVLLREHHIPAIRGVDGTTLTEGSIYELNTYGEEIWKRDC